MIRDNQPWQPLPRAELSWGEEQAPQSRHYGDIYFSNEDGAAESSYVFIEGNALPQRWQQLPPQASGDAFRIGELGFGSGLNFLLSWAAWRKHAGAAQRLHYWAVEHQPLSAADLGRCLQRWPALAPLAAQLLSQYPAPVPGNHRLLFEGGRVMLDLVLADAEEAVLDLCSHGQRWFDAWYLDGFAPARNPQMWQASLWQGLAALSRSGATVATFSAAGAVRRGLEAAGFSMQRRPGFGRKRECLHGSFSGHSGLAAATANAGLTPWDQCRATYRRPQRAMVIGAGIAGCAAAAALAARGLQVSVLDAGPIAGEGSGNRQGVIYTRLSHRHSALSDFALHSFLFATRRVHSLLEAGALRQGRDGALCGMLQLVPDAARLQALGAAYAAVPELVRAVDAAEAGALAGLATSSGGLWFKDAGWLHPAAVCRALLQHPGIETHSHCGPLQLTATQEGWQISGERLAAGSVGVTAAMTTEVVVIAAGVHSAGLLSEPDGLSWLPLRPIRGQTSHLQAAALPGALRCVLCHSGYISPALEGLYCAGATFAPGDSSCSLRAADHTENLQALGTALPPWRDALDALSLNPGDSASGRAALRCASPDYLPLVGPVPAAAAFRATYAALAHNARQPVAQPAPCLPGLFISTAFGSRGLSYAMLGAEQLAAQVCNAPPPLSRHMQRALSPARFLLRELVRAA